MINIGSSEYHFNDGKPHDPSIYYGKIIKEAVMDGDSLRLNFVDGLKIRIFDNGQSCCESRYMTCDDDVQSLVGNILTNISVKNFTCSGSDDTHEICFLEIGTNKGFITIATHNEHNGYYGGFGLEIIEI